MSRSGSRRKIRRKIGPEHDVVRGRERVSEIDEIQSDLVEKGAFTTAKCYPGIA
jgi:hypothetical protein